jgi:peroxiredoxin
MLGFEAAMPQFQALGAQVVGVSTDPALSLSAWQKENNAAGKQILLSDFPRRQMLTAYGALETNTQSPVYRYAKRAYFIIDKTGTVPTRCSRPSRSPGHRDEVAGGSCARRGRGAPRSDHARRTRFRVDAG